MSEMWQLMFVSWAIGGWVVAIILAHKYGDLGSKFVALAKSHKRLEDCLIAAASSVSVLQEMHRYDEVPWEHKESANTALMIVQRALDKAEKDDAKNVH